MKRIFLTVAACGCLSACSNQTKEVSIQEETIQAPVTGQVVAEAVKDTVAVADAVSGASVKTVVALNGVILIPPQQRASVSNTMGGKIHSVNILPGQFVKKDALLATLENPEFIDLQQAYLEAQAQSEYLSREYQRQEQLSKEEAASQKKFQQSKADYLSMKSKLDASAVQLRLLGVTPEQLATNGIMPYIEVRSPLNGYVSELDINLGKYVNTGEAICEVIDKGETLICLTAYEKDLPVLEIGKPVRFKVNGMGDEWFDAVVMSIGQKIDETNRSLDVYARVKQNHPRFRPGMYVAANLEK